MSAALLLALLCVAPDAGRPPVFPRAFSAKYVAGAEKGKQSSSGTMYFGPDRVRVEAADHKGRQTVLLIDFPKNRIFLLLPDQQAVTDMGPVAEQGAFDNLKIDPAKGPCVGHPEWACKKIGKEKVAGRDTVRWESAAPDGKVQVSWVDAVLHIPIKSESSDGAWNSMEEIKEGAPAAALLEIPKEYRLLDGMKLKQKAP